MLSPGPVSNQKSLEGMKKHYYILQCTTNTGLKNLFCDAGVKAYATNL